MVWCVGLLVLARSVQPRNRALAAGLASMCAWYFGCCACVFDPLGIVNWIMD